MKIRIKSAPQAESGMRIKIKSVPQYGSGGSAPCYSCGGQVMANYGLTVHDGGNAQLMSFNRHSPGPTGLFTGQSHAKGGVEGQFHGKPFEAQGGEPFTFDRTGALNIWGGMPMPGTNTTFQAFGKKIGKMEAQNNKEMLKIAKEGAKLNKNNPYSEISLRSLDLRAQGIDADQRELAAMKGPALAMQNRMLDIASALNMDPGDLYGKKGKTAKKGARIPKYQTGGQPSGDIGLMEYLDPQLTPYINPTQNYGAAQQLAGEIGEATERARSFAQQQMAAQQPTGEDLPDAAFPAVGNVEADDETNIKYKQAFASKETGRKGRKDGVDPSYFMHTKINPEKNTAFGKYQFTKGTREDYYKKFFKEEFKSANAFDDAFKKDPNLQERVMTVHLNTLRQRYKNDPSLIALAHVLGSGSVDHYIKTGKFKVQDARGKTQLIGLDEKFPEWNETPRQYARGVTNNLGVRGTLAEQGARIPKYQYGIPYAPRPIQQFNIMDYINPQQPRLPGRPLDPSMETELPIEYAPDPVEYHPLDPQGITPAAQRAQQTGVIGGIAQPRYTPLQAQQLNYQLQNRPATTTTDSTTTINITGNPFKTKLKDIAPQLASLFERAEPVSYFQYQPRLHQQASPAAVNDLLAQNASNYRAAQRGIPSGPQGAGIRAALAAQKYEADQKVLGQQFRTTQEMQDRIAQMNTELLNQAQMQNISLADQSAVRGSQARSVARATRQNAARSIQEITQKNAAQANMFNMINQGVGRGNWGYDPTTGALVKLNTARPFTETSMAASPAMAGTGRYSTFKDGKYEYMVEVDDSGRMIGQPQLMNPDDDTKKATKTKAAYWGQKLKRM